MSIETWKDGQLQPCTVDEFTAGLRHLGQWADKEFSYNSNPSAYLGERLKAAANLIDALHKRG